MAQRRRWVLLLFLQTWLEAAKREASVIVVNGILGESATFPLHLPESEPLISIAWTSRTSVAFVIPGDKEESAPKVTVTHRNYNNRIKVTDRNYDLVISDLRMEDAGGYQADINTKTHHETTTKHYHLYVFRRVGKPKITQRFMTSGNSTCNVTLTCSLEKEEANVTYSWSPLGEKGNILQIVQTPGDRGLNYTCTAWNPVSNNSNSISAQQLCTDPTLGVRARHTGLLSGLVVLFLLVLILSAVFLLCLHKRSPGSCLRTFAKNPDADSKKTIYTYATVSRDSQPAEARIYDEIPPCKVLPSKGEPVNTIYSAVEYSDKMVKTSPQDRRPLGSPQQVKL